MSDAPLLALPGGSVLQFLLMTLPVSAGVWLFDSTATSQVFHTSRSS